MTSRMPVVLLALLTSLSGCAKDYSLSPPADSEVITVRVKVPDELEAETMQVMYRSATCKRTRHDANGKPYQLDGFHGIDMQPQRQGQSDIYETKLPKDGGGPCKWHLANVIFGVAYHEPNRFGENVRYGAGGGLVVIFDHNNSPRGGVDFKVKGDLTVRADYYPWVNEAFIGGYRKRVNIAGSGGIYLMYQALNAREVYFEPTLHSKFVVYSQQPKVHKKGLFTTFTYPDGSVVTDGHSEPDFDRLQAIRQAKESNAERRTKP